MPNEILLFLDLLVIYSLVVLLYRWFGKTGLYMWTVIATIAANIEVLILVDAFGMEQTLGNILFASTFLVTDILSETEGKHFANVAVKLGIIASIIFIVISQSWFLFTPNANDWVMPSIVTVFSNTPRLMLVSIAVYGVVQVFDVYAYHFIWKWSEHYFKDSHKGLWIRNNGSTLFSQFLNTIFFTFGAFLGIYPVETILNICFSSYIIYVATSLLDTPFVYLARRVKEKGSVKEI